MPVLALVLARLAGVDAFRHKVFAAFFPDDLYVANQIFQTTAATD